MSHLKLSNLLAKLFALMGVVPGDVAACLHDADGTAAENDPLDVQSGHEDLDPTVHPSQDVGLGHQAVFEDQLAGRRAPQTQLVQLGSLLEPIPSEKR